MSKMFVFYRNVLFLLRSTESFVLTLSLVSKLRHKEYTLFLENGSKEFASSLCVTMHIPHSKILHIHPPPPFLLGIAHITSCIWKPIGHDNGNLCMAH